MVGDGVVALLGAFGVVAVALEALMVLAEVRGDGVEMGEMCKKFCFGERGLAKILEQISS